MTEIIGVKFRNASKIYYFNPKDFEIHYNDAVIVETARGLEYGHVILTPMEIEEEKVPQPFRDVVRMADEKDKKQEEENATKEAEAYRICKQKITERMLDMKLIRAEYTFDNSKVLFYFTADGRIDFRELVKDLAGIFKTRIELRQIGVRDETKILGGMGICGRPLCCHTYLTEFAPVSIKMAKEQNLSLNPAKISGTCGRLMCCLKNEADTYAYLNKGLPNKGDQCTTPEGRHAEVQSVNILRQTVKMVVDMDNDEKELQEYHISEITFIPHSKRPKPQQNQMKQKDQAGQAKQPSQPKPNQPKPEKMSREAFKEKIAGTAKDEKPDSGAAAEAVQAAEAESPEGNEHIEAEAAPKPKRRRRRNRSKKKNAGAGQENLQNQESRNTEDDGASSEEPADASGDAE